MATLSHVWSTTVKVPGLPTLPADTPITVTGDVDTPIEVDVPAGQVVTIDNLNILRANIQSLVIEATGPVTVSTNVQGSPFAGDVFALAAKKSVAWHNQLNTTLFPLPITKNITKIIIDNSGGTATVTFNAAFLCND